MSENIWNMEEEAPDLDEVLYESIKAAVLGGDKIMEVYEAAGNDASAMKLEYKKDSSPVTAADKASNAVILDVLRYYFPNIAFLAEEEEDDRARLSARYVFVIDPLDGTKEFIKRNGQFAINIALCDDGHPVTGVIYAPVSRELYWAAKGMGVWSTVVKPEVNREWFEERENGESEDDHWTIEDILAPGTFRRLHVSARLEEPNGLRVVASNSHPSEELEELLSRHKIAERVNIGSALKGCIIAKGQAEVYYRFGSMTSEWDTAAMQCIVECAGGLLRRMDGGEMTYNRENCRNEGGFYVLNRKENVLS